eukprot:3294143-Pleurochrysis_carterae.AAC.1
MEEQRKRLRCAPRNAKRCWCNVDAALCSLVRRRAALPGQRRLPRQRRLAGQVVRPRLVEQLGLRARESNVYCGCRSIQRLREVCVSDG